GEAADTVLEGREGLGFTSARIDQVDLPLVGTVRRKREARTVGRPRGRLAGFLRVRQLVVRSRLDLGDPDLRFVRVVVPVRVSNGVGDVAAVGRYLGRPHALQRQNLIDGGRNGGLRAKHLGCGERRDRERQSLFHGRQYTAN